MSDEERHFDSGLIRKNRRSKVKGKPFCKAQVDNLLIHTGNELKSDLPIPQEFAKITKKSTQNRKGNREISKKSTENRKVSSESTKKSTQDRKESHEISKKTTENRKDNVEISKKSTENRKDKFGIRKKRSQKRRESTTSSDEEWSIKIAKENLCSTKAPDDYFWDKRDMEMLKKHLDSLWATYPGTPTLDESDHKDDLEKKALDEMLADIAGLCAEFEDK